MGVVNRNGKAALSSSRPSRSKRKTVVLPLGSKLLCVCFSVSVLFLNYSFLLPISSHSSELTPPLTHDSTLTRKSQTTKSSQQRRVLWNPPIPEFPSLSTKWCDATKSNETLASTSITTFSSQTTTIPEQTICVNGTLSNFVHPPPHFLPGPTYFSKHLNINNQTDEDFFLLQPENRASLRDDWVDWSWETCVTLRPGSADLYGDLSERNLIEDGFQHFHDNALGLVFQMRQAFDMVQAAVMPCRLREHLGRALPRDYILNAEWDMLRFPSRGGIREKREALERGWNQRTEVVLRRYPRDANQVRVHPDHVAWLRTQFPTPTNSTDVDPSLVVWVSRQNAPDRRFHVDALPRVLEYMRNHIYQFDYFVPSKNQHSIKLGPLVDRLGRACAVIGVHGGQLYNQFFAHANTAIIELIALDARGLVHDQVSADDPPYIAHRAIWHNANLLGQPYWRLHFPSEDTSDYGYDEKLLARIMQVLELAGCRIKHG